MVCGVLVLKIVVFFPYKYSSLFALLPTLVLSPAAGSIGQALSSSVNSVSGAAVLHIFPPADGKGLLHLRILYSRDK